MYLIVGLGNPEENYLKTRHNMGFNVINEISKIYEIDLTREKFNGLYGKGIIENNKVILLKPQTYMNLSGNSIKEFIDFYKIHPSKLIVIYDDIDIIPGKIRIRIKGGPGTHNGMKSVVNSLKTEDFIRIRVGIGKPDKGIDLADYVISYIDEEQMKQLNKGVNIATEAVIDILKNGLDLAMNKYN